MEFYKAAEFVEFVAEMATPCVLHTMQAGNAPYNHYYNQEAKHRKLNILTGAIVVVGERETLLHVTLEPKSLVPDGWSLIEGKRLFRRETRKMDMLQVLLDSGVSKDAITQMRKTKVSTLREVCDNSLAKQRTNEETLTISELVEKVTTKGMVDTFDCEEFGKITIEVSPDGQNQSGLLFDFTVDWTEKVDAWLQDLTDAMSTTELSLYDGVLGNAHCR